MVVEAVDPFKWAPTSMSNTYKVFHNLHMLWMCICMRRYHITTALVSKAFGLTPTLLYFSRGKPQRSARVEAVELLGWVLTSMSSTHKMFHNIHAM